MNEELDSGAAEFALRARAVLESSARRLPARVRSRLTQGRHAALEQRAARRATRRASFGHWLPAGAVAAAVLTVLIAQAPRLGAGLPRASSGGNDDFEMLADSSAYALAQDQLAQDDAIDYEFYDWAVATDQEEHSAEAGS